MVKGLENVKAQLKYEHELLATNSKFKNGLFTILILVTLSLVYRGSSSNEGNLHLGKRG